MIDELTAILDELKAQHGTDAAVAAAAGVTKNAICLLRKGERGLGLKSLRGLLRATGDITLQGRLLQVSGISDALMQGQGWEAKGGG